MASHFLFSIQTRRIDMTKTVLFTLFSMSIEVYVFIYFNFLDFFLLCHVHECFACVCICVPRVPAAWGGAEPPCGFCNHHFRSTLYILMAIVKLLLLMLFQLRVSTAGHRRYLCQYWKTLEDCYCKIMVKLKTGSRLLILVWIIILMIKLSFSLLVLLKHRSILDLSTFVRIYLLGK